MKKLLSILLVLTLMFGYCTYCFASNNDESDQVKTRSHAQEKEIDMCSEKLKKQLDEINELKSMSKDSYYWYRCKQILKSLFKFAFKCGCNILFVYLGYLIGYSSGLAEELRKSGFFNGFSHSYGNNYNAGYKKGHSEGFAEGKRSCPGGGVPLPAKEAFIKKFIKVCTFKIHPDTFSGKDKESKIKANLESLSRNLNNLQECIEKGDCDPNNLR